MRILSLAAAVVIVLLTGCGTPYNVLRVTTSGGDANPPVSVSPAGQLDVSQVNVGDTVVFAPGSMRAVVKSPTFTVTLVEPGNVTAEETKKALAINRRDGAKIEVMKGKLFRGDVFLQGVTLNLSNHTAQDRDIPLTLLAFNRGEKAFRGDLTVYDFLPPELEYLGTDPAAKYNDRRGMKGFLDATVFLSFISMAMDNFSRSNEPVDMQHERLGDLHKYTFRRMVLEPGQAVGFVVKTRYRLPETSELEDLRLQARPVQPQGQQ